MRTAISLAFALALAATVAVAAPPPQQPSHSSSLDERGAHVMGFDQQKTTHHFYLYPDGGAIEVSANDVNDETNLKAARAHLPHIAKMFGDGDFSAPVLVHETNVPGSADLAKLKDRLSYRYEETPRGGRVNILTRDADALAALHSFLRFQIADHKTGDAPDVRPR
jgi:hypothetical protein